MEKFYAKIVKRILFPLILLVFPMVKMALGVELADTGYSLGNYRFFPAAEGVWVLNTYLSNVAGYLFTLLPFGKLMLGMKFYTALFISVTALLGYRFFYTKMPAWVAFLGEMTAIGLCWCPTTILYNYMTYFFFLLGALLLFRGLAGERPRCLVLAGVCLGLNIFVRNPNVLEAALILCVWYYGILLHKDVKKVIRETLYCLAGYVGAIVVMVLVMMLHYGIQAPVNMVQGLFQMAGSAEDYTFLQMLGAIADAYLHGMKWLLYMILCVLPGIPFLMIRENKFPRARKVIYCVGIVFLFIVLGKWGMYNLKYYQKESALQWAVIFLMIALGNMIWMLFTKSVDIHWKLIASIGIVVILITPLGSNNHVWPVINNLFLAAPATFWMVYKFARWGKHFVGTESTLIPLFPLKAMEMAIIAAVLVQSLGVGCFYVFNDGETGEAMNTKITQNAVTRGMYTSETNAQNLEELSMFLDIHPQWGQRELILYGDIPALSYYLDRDTAIFNSWPDLDTNSASRLSDDLDGISRQIMAGEGEKPLVIINAKLSEEKENNPKKEMIDTFLKDNDYGRVFVNEQFVVFS